MLRCAPFCLSPSFFPASPLHLFSRVPLSEFTFSFMPEMSTRFASNIVRVCGVYVCACVETSTTLWHLLLYYLHTNYMGPHTSLTTQTNAVSATVPWGCPLFQPSLPATTHHIPASLSDSALTLHLFLLPCASYANTRNIFQMLFAFALHTIFACAACLFTFFNFPRSLCCRR